MYLCLYYGRNFVYITLYVYRNVVYNVSLDTLTENKVSLIGFRPYLIAQQILY